MNGRPSIKSNLLQTARFLMICRHPRLGPGGQREKPLNLTFFFQYQHLNLLIGFPRPEGADDSEPGFTVGVKCCDITTRGVYNFTPVDISLDEIDFFSLIDDLNQAEHIDFSLETHSLKYKLPSSPKSLLAINSSLTLQRAISALRAPMCSEIRLWAVANEEVVVSCWKYDMRIVY